MNILSLFWLRGCRTTAVLSAAVTVCCGVWSDRCFAQEYQWQWAKRAGGTGSDIATHICAGAHGDLYVAGGFAYLARFGTNTLEATSRADVFVARMDPTGEFRWARQMGLSQYDNIVGMTAARDGGVHICGSLYEGGTIGTHLLGPGSFVAKLNADSDVEWARTVPTTSTIAEGNEGGVYIAGGGGDWAPLALTKLDEAGNEVWNTSEYNLWARVRTMAVSSADEVFVAGNFDGTSVFGTDLSTSGEGDMFLAKFSSSGNVLWVVRVGGERDFETDEAATAIAVDLQGNPVLTGTARPLVPDGIKGPFVAKFDGQGGMLWATQTGGYYQGGTAVEVDSQNNIYVCGFFYGQARFGLQNVYSRGYSDLFLAKYDPQGNVLWVMQAGDTKDEYVDLLAGPQDFPSGMAITDADDLYLAGGFGGPMSMGPDSIDSEGMKDVFIARYGITPFIHVQPQGKAELLGGSATLSVVANGGEPLEYQWWKEGEPLPGATNAVLTIDSVEVEDAGEYSVVVSNQFGTAHSLPAILVVNTEGVAIELYAGVRIVGQPGSSYSVRAATSLSDPNWITVTNITLSTTSYLWFDPEPATHPRRYYSVVPAP
jgi:hypothetical protein